MKKYLVWTWVIIIAGSSGSHAQSLSDTFGQQAALKPVLIAPGTVSTVQGEYSPAFSIGRNELLFMRRTPGQFDYTIYTSQFSDGKWSEPVVAPFSGTYRDAGISLSPDGKSAYFDSARPVNGLPSGSINIWKAERDSSAWRSEVKFLSGPSANEADEPTVGNDEFGPVVDAFGNLYIYSFRRPYRNGSRYISEGPDYINIRRNTAIPDPSTSTFVSYLYISPDGRTALMDGRTNNAPSGSIYYSCLNENDIWTPAKLLPLINDGGSIGGPSLSSDGKWLFYAGGYEETSEDPGNSDLYMISTQNLPVPCPLSR